MVVETIYVTRHGVRLRWDFDEKAGKYLTFGPSPTGIPNDPVLTAQGLQQANELAAKAVTLSPPVDVILCSPYYRCLQTIAPTGKQLMSKGLVKEKILVERGFGEFFGVAHYEHPPAASLEELSQEHFPDLLNTSYESELIPYIHGETIEELHERVAYVIHSVIEKFDAMPNGPKTIFICTHAACMIILGRVLTGDMPEDVATDDFQCYTASLSRYRRKGKPQVKQQISKWNPQKSKEFPQTNWKGSGVQGGWICEANSDCDHLSSGPARGWKFYGDESYVYNPYAKKGASTL